MATLLANVVRAVQRAVLPSPGIAEAEEALMRGDLATSTSILKRLSEDGNPEAGRMLGIQYAFGDPEYRNPAEAMRLFRVAADAGSLKALVHIGELLHVGRGVPEDPMAAITFYRQAAEKEEPLGALLLGATLLEGDGDAVAPEPEEGVTWLRVAVDHGYGDAMLILGEAYRDGRGIETNYDEAMRIFRAGAAKPYAACERAIGAMYEQGLGVPEDPAEAFRWYVRASAGGDPKAAANVAACYANGRGVEKNERLAALYREEAADRDDTPTPEAPEQDGQEGGEAAESGPMPRVSEKGPDIAASGFTRTMIEGLTDLSPPGPALQQAGVACLEEQIEAGDLDAAFMLAMLYDQGRGVPEDPAEALRLLQLCVDGGDANAERSVGIMYLHGRGVRRDREKALTWTRRAADHGSAEAMADLGVEHLWGGAVPVDTDTAMEWLTKAADAGSVRAISILGQQYLLGNIVPKDAIRGLQLSQCAAGLGDARAMRHLGLACATGRDVEKDLDSAEAWLCKALAAGDEEAEEILDEVRAERLGFA